MNILCYADVSKVVGYVCRPGGKYITRTVRSFFGRPGVFVFYWIIHDIFGGIELKMWKVLETERKGLREINSDGSMSVAQRVSAVG